MLCLYVHLVKGFFENNVTFHNWVEDFSQHQFDRQDCIDEKHVTTLNTDYVKPKQNVDIIIEGLQD